VLYGAVDGLYAQCEKLAKEGYAIDARVATLAEGYRVREEIQIDLMHVRH
jgi:hypothetical protein